MADQGVGIGRVLGKRLGGRARVDICPRGAGEVMGQIFGQLLECVYDVREGVNSDGTMWRNLAPLTVGLHNLEPSGASAPTISAGTGPSSQDEISFNGTSQFLETARDFTFVRGDRPCIITVMRWNDLTETVFQCAVGIGQNNTGNQTFMHNCQLGPTTDDWQFDYHYDNGNGGAFDVVENITNDTSRHRFETLILAAGATGRIDGTDHALAQTAGVSADAANTQRMVIGANLSTGTDLKFAFMNGFFSFHMVLNGEPTAQQLTDARTWIDAEFGL